MAVITATDMKQASVFTAAITTLGASDTFVYNTDKKPILVLHNATGGALTPKIDGADGTVVNVNGIGSVDVSAGYTFASIGAGATVCVTLKDISKFLQGVITVTGGSGIRAQLLEF